MPKLILIILISGSITGNIFAFQGNGAVLFRQGKEHFQKTEYEKAIELLTQYLKEYGHEYEYADDALYYLAESYSNALGEYNRAFNDLYEKREDEVRRIIGEKLYKDLETASIEKNKRMGMGQEFPDKQQDQVLFGVIHLYAEKMFLEKYGKHKRFKTFEVSWYAPCYSKDEYVELLERFPQSEYAKYAFLRLLGMRTEFNENSPMGNFSLHDYEGFGTFVGLIKQTHDLYMKYRPREGLSEALKRLNLLYPAAGHIEVPGELDEAIKLYREIIYQLPADKNAGKAQEIVDDMEVRKTRRSKQLKYRVQMAQQTLPLH